jgi:hemoglobin/transferrin/lactoferrin receptor protein
VHDIYASWTSRPGRLRELSVTLGVDNVFDEFYRPHLSELPTPGRNVKLGFTAQF